MNLALLPHHSPSHRRHIFAWTCATSLWCSGKTSQQWFSDCTTKRRRIFRLARFVLLAEKTPLIQTTNNCLTSFPTNPGINNVRKDEIGDNAKETIVELNRNKSEDDTLLLETTRKENSKSNNGACLDDSNVALTHSSVEENGRSEEDIVFLDGVTKTFGRKRVLDNLTLGFRQGTAIIGASGTGKSTLIRLIAGLDLPDSGSVWIHSWRRTKHISEEMSPHKVSMVFQQSALFDSMNVFENVGFELLCNTDLPEDRIMELVVEALERVGLRDILELYPNNLSGGEQRRVAFARAILYDPDDPESAPEVILYDEPSTGLDPPSASRVEQCIRNLRSVCSTYIVVTHSLSTMRTADRVIFLHKGKVVWDGPVADVDRTDNPYVRQFVSADTDGPLSYD